MRRCLSKHIETAATFEDTGAGVIDDQFIGYFEQLVPGPHVHLLFPGFDEDGDELRVRPEMHLVEFLIGEEAVLIKSRQQCGDFLWINATGPIWRATFQTIL